MRQFGAIMITMPEKLIGDKAYDSDPFDRHLDEEYGIEIDRAQP
jgi:hypothetical protein